MESQATKYFTIRFSSKKKPLFIKNTILKSLFTCKTNFKKLKKNIWSLQYLHLGLDNTCYTFTLAYTKIIVVNSTSISHI